MSNNGSGALFSSLQSLGHGKANQLAKSSVFDAGFRRRAVAAANNGNATTGRNDTGSAIGMTGFTTGQASAAGMSSDFLTNTSKPLALSSGAQVVAAINSVSPNPMLLFRVLAWKLCSVSGNYSFPRLVAARTQVGL